MIFNECICAKLGGTMRIFKKSMEKPFRISFSQSWPKNSTYWFNWCQDTIGFQKGSLIEGEQDFIKSCHGSLKWFHFAKLMIQVWLCAPKWISHEFLVNLKIIQNSFFLAHNHPPIMNWGGARKLFKYQTRLNQTTFLFPKCFSTYLNQLRSKISKGLIF